MSLRSVLLRESPLPLSSSQVDALERHFDLLIRWNARLNLTRITDPDQAAVRHYCESLFVAANLPDEAQRIVDLGSGAGFPGFPLAVVRPDCEVTLVESHKRKAVFLKECCRTHANLRVLSQRAEDIKERFDVLVMRAVECRSVRDSLARLANDVLILLSEKDLDDARADLEFVWHPARRLPWTGSGLLLHGSQRST